jgi:hypothetical protein
MSLPETDPGPFPKRLTFAIAAIAGVCLVGSFVLMFTGRRQPAGSAGPDSTSRSGLGHAAFADLLRESGIPVVVSRHETRRRTRSGSLLLLIEPRLERGDSSNEALSELIRTSGCPVLLVLPKRRPVMDDGEPPRLVDTIRMGPAEVDTVLAAADTFAHTLPAKRVRGWTTNLGADPEIDEPLFVKTTGGWTPLIDSDAGVLVADREEHGHKLAVLADPDLVENHGLHRGANARIALALVARLRAGSGPVIIDETFHGLAVPESFWAQLFSFPLGLATLQAAIAAALLLWAGMRRFGAPEAPPPPFDPGTAFLTTHTAALLEGAAHHAEAVVRYATLAAEDAARELHAESGRGADRDAELAVIEGRRKTTDRIADLEAEGARLAGTHSKDARAALRLARRIRNWRQEIVDGSNVRSGVR